MTGKSPLVERARALARDAHAGQLRKAGNLPYFAHLEAVARLLASHGYEDEILLASAYLHDLLEDRPAFAQRLRSEMPKEVVETVEALTETKRDASGHERDKAARFADYVRVLGSGTAAALRALPVSCADKIDNAQSLVAAERDGHHLLSRLNTRLDEHEPQLATVRALYAPVVRPELLASFDQAAEELLATITRVRAQRRLFVVLDEPSRQRVRALAVHAVVRGDHVTLAPRVDPASFEPSWIPGSADIGDTVEVRAVGQARDERLQALVVEMNGEPRRPFDGGTLHITVSRAPGARSFESNALLSQNPALEPLDLTLTGRIEWVAPT